MTEEKKVTRRRFLNYAVTAVLTGVVAGVGSYYAGLLSAPPRTTTTTVTAPPTTTTITSPPVTRTVSGPERTTTITSTTTVTSPQRADVTPKDVVSPDELRQELDKTWQTGGAGREALREELGEFEKDVIPERYLIDEYEQTWTSETTMSQKHLGKPSRYYNARMSDFTPPGSYPIVIKRPHLTDIDVRWTDDGLTIPSGYYNYLAVYSRASLAYPFCGAYTKLPDLTAFPNGTDVFPAGFEHGGTSKTGIASFKLAKTGGAIYFYAGYGSYSWLTIDISSRLPADYLTVAHNYYVKVNKWGAEFFIDNRLAAVILDIPEAVQKVKATAPPYGIGVSNAHVIKRLHTLVEIMFPYPTSSNIITNPGSLTIPLTPKFFRWGEDEPNPPRALRLYQANSDNSMVGASISSGSLSSHPVPLHGRDDVTFYFRADKAGTLKIEVLTLSGNWRSYDELSTTADKLLVYIIDGDAVLARVTFTPSTYTATISEAEVFLA